MLRPFRWRGNLFVLLLSWLVSCGQGSNAEWLVASAQKAEQEGQLSIAAELYHRAAALKPDDFNTHYHAALLYLQLTRSDEAAEHLTKAAALKPDSATDIASHSDSSVRPHDTIRLR
jgi:Flp pilus assembly protein TadD